MCIPQLRKQGTRVRDLLREWDCDRSNSVSLDEFVRALKQLGIAVCHAWARTHD